MKSLLLIFGLFLLSPAALAQDNSAHDEQPDQDGEALEIFDQDADDNDEGWPRLALGLGYMWAKASGSYRIRGAGGNEVTLINFDQLGIDDRDASAWMNLKWRSRSSNWGAWAAYWTFSGAGFQIWEDELDLGDGTTIPAAIGVGTEFTTDWYILEATYSFVHNERWDVGIGAGFHVVDVDTSLAVGATIGDESQVEQVVRLDTLAPLPNILAYGRWRFSERWQATARYGWFGLSYDEYDGEMTNLHALLMFNISERWAFEAGYQLVKLDVDVNRDRFTERFDMEFNGPMIGLNYAF